MNALSFRSRILLSLALLASLAAIWDLLPGNRLKARHADLLTWAQSGSPSEFPTSFASPDYHDQWQHSPESIAENMRAVRYAFPSLSISASPPVISRNGRSATIRQSLSILGTDSPRQAEFTFTWQRPGWQPWRWQLVSVSAPSLDLP